MNVHFRYHFSLCREDLLLTDAAADVLG